MLPMQKPISPAQIMADLVREVAGIASTQDQILKRIRDLETTGRRITAEDFQTVSKRLAASESLILAMKSRAKKEIASARRTGAQETKSRYLNYILYAICAVCGAGAAIIAEKMLVSLG